MTSRHIVISVDQPDTEKILTALGDSPTLKVVAAPNAPFFVLSQDDVALATIELPRLVRVSGEAQRVLGWEDEQANEPAWWLTIHHGKGDAAGCEIAQAYAKELAELVEGVVWCSD